jgi:hypothetical protein
MQAYGFSADTTLKTAKAQKSTAVSDLIQSKPTSAISAEAVARRVYANYERQGSQPGHEVKHWLEAEAQLFGGVERESQMHSGSSLFTTEH